MPLKYLLRIANHQAAGITPPFAIRKCPKYVVNGLLKWHSDKCWLSALFGLTFKAVVTPPVSSFKQLDRPRLELVSGYGYSAIIASTNCHHIARADCGLLPLASSAQHHMHCKKIKTQTRNFIDFLVASQMRAFVASSAYHWRMQIV